MSPGDFVIANDDDIRVTPPPHLDSARPFAADADPAETGIRAAIAAGEDRQVVDPRVDRWAPLKEKPGR